MTDNFDIFKSYIMEAGIPVSKNTINDKFFVIYLIRRGKDHPNMPAANYTLKIYYIDSIDSYINAKEEIKLISKITGTRAYITVNCKSKSKSVKNVLKKIASSLYEDNVKKPWNMFSQACNEIENKNDKRWIVDVDNIKILSEEERNQKLSTIYKIIESCNTKYDNHFIGSVPTKSGIHIICRPFNTSEFENKCKEQLGEVPDIKKNHITLLYEDL